MKKLCRKITAILFAVIFTAVFSSCSESDGTGALVKYAFDQDPKNLDPQLAEDIPSMNVITNMFEGLFKISADGTISNGVAESYTVSDDRLTYVFYLRKDAFWVGRDDYQKQVTAADFVFALQRLVNPNTGSPYYDDYFCIKNAEKIHESSLPASSLGVTAADDFTLKIQLEYPNADFLRLLTKTSSMPCCRDFFYSTKGKYGLETSAVICNGAFYLHQWLYDPYGNDNYLILRKNQLYSDYLQVSPSSLNYFINRDSNASINDFINDELDFIVDNGKTSELLNKKDVKSNAYEIYSSGIIFNMNKPVFQTEEIRQALAICIDRGLYQNELSASAKAAYGLIPAGVTMLNKSFRELTAEPALTAYNLTLAQYLWTSSLTQAEKTELASASIIVPESFLYSQNLDSLITQWGQSLELFCAVEVLSDSEYQKRLSSGNFYFAAAEITSAENSPSPFLESFTAAGDFGTLGYADEELDALLDSAMKQKTLTEKLLDFQSAEKLIIDKYYYIPLFYENEYLFFSTKITDVIYDPFSKQLDFSATKKF
ncbi:MAG: peptide ABC transporter substrate-binding protein [Oscillospiraceae bacterium]